jgi:hypothetical protein
MFDQFVLIAFASCVAGLQVWTAVRLVRNLRQGSLPLRGEAAFDFGALLFLTGIQSLLIRSLLGSSSLSVWWTNALILTGIVVLLGSVVGNLFGSIRRQR